MKEETIHDKICYACNSCVSVREAKSLVVYTRSGFQNYSASTQVANG